MLFKILLWVFLWSLLSTASLSPKMKNHLFTNNKIIKKNWKIIQVSGNLQYLIWEIGVWSYENLSSEHKKFIQELADLILTDEYAKNIEGNKRSWSRWYDIVSSWEKKLKTSSLWLFLKRTINLLWDIQRVSSFVDWSYDKLLKTLNKYEEKKWYKTDPKVYELLETLKPEIESILAIHKLLDEKGLKLSMDSREKEKVILAEIKRIEGTIKNQEGTIKNQEGTIKNQEGTIRKLDEYLKTLNRFLDVNWRSQ